MKEETKRTLDRMRLYGSRHYPLSEVVVARALGTRVRDTEGREYIDAAAGYSSMNFGHGHPEIMAFLKTLSDPDEDGWYIPGVAPNVYSNPWLGLALEKWCKLLDLDRALVTNGGGEATEAALKMMRKWGYTKKGITEDRARIISFEGNFHGRTSAIVGLSEDPVHRGHFGPYADDIIVPWADLARLESTLVEHGHEVAGIMMEIIQGERGVRIPPPGFVKGVRELARKYKVAFCADEIQTGLGRTGTLLASWAEGVHDPDLVVIGKSLGAGDRAVAMVLGKEEFMCFSPGEHGSTYGGNSRAMAIAGFVHDFILAHDVCRRSRETGAYLLGILTEKLGGKRWEGIVREVRGRALMIGIELAESVDTKKAMAALLSHGIMTKDAHGVIRITPSLFIDRTECDEFARRIVCAFRTLKKDGAARCATCSCEE